MLVLPDKTLPTQVRCAQHSNVLAYIVFNKYLFFYDADWQNPTIETSIKEIDK